jgi:hypothetical protein
VKPKAGVDIYTCDTDDISSAARLGWGMPRLWIALLTTVSLSMGATTATRTPAQAAKSKASVAGLPLPPRARIQEDGTYRAARGYRKTVVYFERYLRRQGIAHERLPTYQVRGVQVTRFLSSSPRSQWLAIHVFKIRGTTHLFVVPRLAKTESDSKE